jgi:pleiotropic regulator 1
MHEYSRIKHIESAPLTSSSLLPAPKNKDLYEEEETPKVNNKEGVDDVQEGSSSRIDSVIESIDDRQLKKQKLSHDNSNAIIAYNGDTSTALTSFNSAVAPSERIVHEGTSRALALRREKKAVETPDWHAPWKLMRVISGHLGWVRCVAVDPTNEWFATGANDRTIKIWDLASGTLKLTLTGHTHNVRGLVVSKAHPYLFSVGEDKMVKCWDLEYNKVIRHYHGHLSGVFSCALHPTIHVLMTGGRDGCVRVWDIRTKQSVFVLAGHKNAVTSVFTQGVDPQVVSGSYDTTIRLWDLAAAKTLATLTQHKKAVRSIVSHPTEFTFASGAGDNIKKWLMPEGKFMGNLEGQNSPINAMSLNGENVLFSGADNGSMHFWDWKTGHCFQSFTTTVQSGSLESEAGIYASSFDQSGSRLITCEADKTIKIWKEDENATPETHPIDMVAWSNVVRANKRY